MITRGDSRSGSPKRTDVAAVVDVPPGEAPRFRESPFLTVVEQDSGEKDTHALPDLLLGEGGERLWLRPATGWDMKSALEHVLTKIHLALNHGPNGSSPKRCPVLPSNKEPAWRVRSWQPTR